MKAKLYKVLDQYHLYDGDKAIATTIVANPMLLPNLYKQNCDEIFGLIDIEKLADEHITHNEDIPQEIKRWLKISYKIGFNKAMELNKYKVFTLKDMKNAFYNGWNYRGEHYQYPKAIKEYLQHLQQPTEIEVEIVMGDPIGITDNYTPDTFPKLDENNCLILKKL